MVANMFPATITFDNLPPHPNDPAVQQQIRLLHNAKRRRDANRRLPTPEKVAITELSNSFEKRRLGKQQQILHDISQRCREEEVADLSKVMTGKCTLKNVETPRKELTFYNTATMAQRNCRPNRFSASTNRAEIQDRTSTMPCYEPNRTHFPARKVLKKAKKFENSTTTTLPKLKLDKENSNHGTNRPTREQTRDVSGRKNGPRPFEYPHEMEEYYFPRYHTNTSRPVVSPNISYQDKVVAYLNSLRAYENGSLNGTNSTSGKSGRSKYDSGIQKAAILLDHRFSPLEPIFTRVGSSTLVTTNRDKVTQTSVTSFL